MSTDETTARERLFEIVVRPVNHNQLEESELLATEIVDALLAHPDVLRALAEASDRVVDWPPRFRVAAEVARAHGRQIPAHALDELEFWMARMPEYTVEAIGRALLDGDAGEGL